MRRILSTSLLLLPALLAGPAFAQEHDHSTDLLKKAVELSLKSSQLAAEGKEKEAQALAGKAAALLKTYADHLTKADTLIEFTAAKAAEEAHRHADLEFELQMIREGEEKSLALRHARLKGLDDDLQAFMETRIELPDLKNLHFSGDAPVQDLFVVPEGRNGFPLIGRVRLLGGDGEEMIEFELLGGDEGNTDLWSEAMDGEGIHFLPPSMSGEWLPEMTGECLPEMTGERLPALSGEWLAELKELEELEIPEIGSLFEGKPPMIRFGSGHGGQQVQIFISPSISFNGEDGRVELKVQTAPTVPLARHRKEVVIVRPGDTLPGISQRELGSVDRLHEIVELNELRKVRELHVGQELRMPVPPVAVPYAEVPHAIHASEARALIQEMRAELEALRIELKALRASVKSDERFR